MKKEEGCGVWSARNLDRVSGNEPRILLQPGRAENGGGGAGGGGERRDDSKPLSSGEGARGQVLSVYGKLISGVRNQSLPEAVTTARFPSSFLTLADRSPPRNRKPPRFRAIRNAGEKVASLLINRLNHHRVREGRSRPFSLHPPRRHPRH